MRHSISLFLLLLATQLLNAQIKTLVKEGMGFPSKKDVTKATVQAETEKTVSIQAEYKGFDEKNKAYKMTATILNQVKTPMKEFESVSIDLDPRGGVADFSFSFTQRPGIQYSPEGIKSSFIEFSVTEKKGDGSSILDANILEFGASKFVFQFKKTWKVKVPVTVEVELVPYKSAAAIKL